MGHRAKYVFRIRQNGRGTLWRDDWPLFSFPTCASSTALSFAILVNETVLFYSVLFIGCSSPVTSRSWISIEVDTI